MVKIFLIWFLSCILAGVMGFFAYQTRENLAFFCAVLATLALCAVAAAGVVFLERLSVCNIGTILLLCVLSLAVTALVYFVLSCIAKKRE